MKHSKLLSIILAAALLSGSVVAYADRTPGNYSLGGAARLLSGFLSANADGYDVLGTKLAALKRFSGDTPTAGETLDPVTYDEPKTGIVCTESSLNIRSRESVLSDVVAYAYQQDEITVTGEHVVSGKRWYSVIYKDVPGYASADFILFGNDAVTYYTNLHELMKSSTVLPKAAVILDDLAFMDSNEDAKAARKTLERSVKDATYSLTYDYPKYEKEENYLNMYSILVYILEKYTRIVEISSAYGLTKTYEKAAADMQTIGLIRENLTDTTDTTDTEFQKQIEKAAEQRQQKASFTLGEQVANFAATFVGVLPYVWGGASLVRGADCSGFCLQVYAHFGYVDQALANVHGADSTSLRNFGRAVPVNEIQPGDMVCYQGHVAIYYGSGLVVHEPSPGKKASYGSLYMAPIITVRRLVP